MSHGGAEKSLFPNSTPVRQSLPSIHSMSNSPSNPSNPALSSASSASIPKPSTGPSGYPQTSISASSIPVIPPYSPSRYKAATTTGASTTSSQSLSSSTGASTANTSKLSPPSLPPLLGTGSSSPSSAVHLGSSSSKSPLPGLSNMGSAPTGNSAKSEAYSPPYPRTNPMSVSSMLSSGPPREPVAAYAAPSAAGSKPSTSNSSSANVYKPSPSISPNLPPMIPTSTPQPPTLPPLSSSTLNGRAPSSLSPNIYRSSPAGHTNASGSSSTAGAMSSSSTSNTNALSSSMNAAGKAKSPDILSMNPNYNQRSGAASSSTPSPNLSSASISTSSSKVERSYPPLPSAFARESPYSNSAWSNQSHQTGYGGKQDSRLQPTQQQQQHQQSQDKPFYPGLHGFGRSTNQNSHMSNPTSASSNNRHPSNSPAATTSYPPTFPSWSTGGGTSKNSTASQQATKSTSETKPSQRPYPDYYSATVDHVRPQQDDHKRPKVNDHLYPTPVSTNSNSSSGVRPESYKPAPLGSTLTSPLLSSQSNNTGKSSHIRYPGGDYPSLNRPNGNIPAPSPPVLPAATSSTTPAGWAANEPSSATLSAPASNMGHKRKRSEGQGNRSRAAEKAKIVKPFVAPFSAIDLRKAHIRPPLVDVQSRSVLQAVSATREPYKESKIPFIGRFVYDPTISPADLIDGQLLRRNIGGQVEVVISTGYFASSSTSCTFEIGSPLTYDGHAIEGTNALSTTVLPACVWDLDSLRKRSVWGTDVYTDDSDIIAILIHSGWLRLADSAAPLAGQKEASQEALLRARTPLLDQKSYACKKGRSLVVRLGVAPALVRYEGSPRAGLKSRSWGNGHDGVSLLVEGVDVIESNATMKGHRSLKSEVRSTAIEYAPSFASEPHFIDEQINDDPVIGEDDDLAQHELFVLGFDIKSSRFLKSADEESSSREAKSDVGMDMD